MATRRRRTKLNIPMCLAGVLLCLTLISIHLASGLYARYSTTSEGSDSARVISFGDLSLTETGDFGSDGTLRIIPGVDLTKKAVIDFEGSESATYVFVEITLANWSTADNKNFSYLVNSKAAMQWRLADGWTFLKKVNNTYVYYRELVPNTVLDDVDIIADNGKITVSEYITRNEITTLTGVSIKLRASVVQSGGFENPTAAWDSLMAKEGGGS